MKNNIFNSCEKIAIKVALEKNKSNKVIIATTSVKAEVVFNIIKTLNPNQQILYFPSWETIAYDKYSPSPNICGSRLDFLYKIQNLSQNTNNTIVITSIDAISSKLCPKSYLDAHGMVLAKNDLIEAKQLVNRLIQAGFQNTSQVRERGEFCLRGSILDVFPVSSKLPIRIDFFDNEVDQIRLFDSKTQLSVSKIDSINIIPSREVDLSDSGRTCFRQNMRSWLGKKAEFHPVYKKISEQEITGGLEYYLPYFFDETESFFDYIKDSYQLLIENNYKSYFSNFLKNAEVRYQRISNLNSTQVLPVSEIFLDKKYFNNQLDEYLEKNLEEDLEESLNHSELSNENLEIESFNFTGEQEDKLKKLKAIVSKGRNILIVSGSEGQQSLLLDKLEINKNTTKSDNWNFSGLGLNIGYLPKSFKVNSENNFYLISTSQIFDYDDSQEQEIDERFIINELSEIKIGDPVVHNEHGVGRYKGLETMTINDETSEFITINYAKGGVLYIPVTSLDTISRYTGASAESAPLHSLDKKQWEKAKQKAKKIIFDTAADLLEIYAKRELAVGEAIEFTEKSKKELATFNKGFSFIPTKDQFSTFEAIYKDLASEKPMDRIVCGDVGFGKTEVAMRAAFVVANSCKQVAILVPTTLLAEQHYKNFVDRFSSFPFVVAAISRFKTAKQQKEILQQVATGGVDIIIGTHRLIQKDVKFKNLGLIIVDEEHRFGVKQKEVIKKMRSNVNILTLTATPIPRTLSMSMAGLRDLSIIASPPPKRTPVHTIFIKYDENIIFEGIERETARGGQIYFVHNDIQTMPLVQKSLQELFPKLRIKHAHAKMREKELEQIMLDFHNQHFDLLITTTIIESGIDNPNANTIFINRADKFGLAQIHQLRGRVGRSHHQAYAYLITPGNSVITADAKKRMAAIASFKTLGVGFMLASQDLEIRGAGELLGDNQTGQITEIGFGLFNEMLEQTIKAIKENKQISFDEVTQITDQATEIEVDLDFSALIPSIYIFDVHLRLVFYKRIANAKTERELDKLQIELIDRFGMLPEEVKTFFLIAEVKLIARKLGISKIIATAEDIDISLHKTHKLNIDKLIKLIQTQPNTYKMKNNYKFSISEQTKTAEKRTDFIKKFLLGMRYEVQG